MERLLRKSISSSISLGLFYFPLNQSSLRGRSVEILSNNDFQTAYLHNLIIDITEIFHSNQPHVRVSKETPMISN